MFLFLIGFLSLVPTLFLGWLETDSSLQERDSWAGLAVIYLFGVGLALLLLPLPSIGWRKHALAHGISAVATAGFFIALSFYFFR